MGRLINTADINNVLMYEKSNYGIFATEINHIIDGIVSKCPTMEQEPSPMLDRMRAEIVEDIEKYNDICDDICHGLCIALDIIDKYKAESEEV